MTPSSTPRSQDFDANALYQKYAPMVYRRILRFYDAQEAEEVLQEVFIKVIEQKESFRQESSPVTWLYRLTTNHCLNRLRDNSRRRELLQQHYIPNRPPAPGPERAQQRVLLEQIWEKLPEELTTVAVHAYVDGMTQKEIARIYGVSDRTISNRLKELAERAKALLGEISQNAKQANQS